MGKSTKNIEIKNEVLENNLFNLNNCLNNIAKEDLSIQDFSLEYDKSESTNLLKKKQDLQNNLKQIFLDYKENNSNGEKFFNLFYYLKFIIYFFFIYSNNLYHNVKNLITEKIREIDFKLEEIN